MSLFMSFASVAKVDRSEPATPDRIVVIGGSTRTLDVLRIAAIRSDDVVLFVAVLAFTRGVALVVVLAPRERDEKRFAGS